MSVKVTPAKTDHKFWNVHTNLFRFRFNKIYSQSLKALHFFKEREVNESDF